MASQFPTRHYKIPELVFDTDTKKKTADGKRRKRRSAVEVFNEKMTALFCLTIKMYHDAELCFDSGAGSAGAKKKMAKEMAKKEDMTWREHLAIFEIKSDYDMIIRLVDYLAMEKEKQENTGCKKKKVALPPPPPPPASTDENENDNANDDEENKDDEKSEEEYSSADDQEDEEQTQSMIIDSALAMQ
jgi:hypothetical protein